MGSEGLHNWARAENVEIDFLTNEKINKSPNNTKKKAELPHLGVCFLLEKSSYEIFNITMGSITISKISNHKFLPKYYQNH